MKLMPDGSLKPEVRLVAQGFVQRFGVEYKATFAPVANTDLIRYLFSTAASYNLCICQVAVETAFLYRKLDEQIFKRQPGGFEDGTNSVWKLKRSLYGLKQAPRCWNEEFTATIKMLGLTPTIDSCIFYKPTQMMVLVIHVDDMLIFSRDKEETEIIVNGLKRKFEIHRVTSGKFLGSQFEKLENGDIYLH